MPTNLPEMNLYQTTIYKSRYARWNEDENRRENWDETVGRYVDFFKKHLKENHHFTIPAEIATKVYDGIYGLDVMPSMRTLMTAGRALESCNVANYNCAYCAVDTVRVFSEHMFILS